LEAGVNVQATVAALTHPSLWHRCVITRRYGKLAGKEAKLRLLQDAIEMAGVEFVELNLMEA
jgi:hypothetical protein